MWALAAALLSVMTSGSAAQSAQMELKPGTETARTIGETECSAPRLGSSVPVTAIGEPVSAVTLDAPVWTAATQAAPAFCSVTGALAPVDKSPTAQPINFRVVLPASWNGRAMQLGGSGINGVIPNLTAPIDGGLNGPSRSIVTYGSDSGHRSGPSVSADWSLNAEAIRNFGYMQMKKTHDAAIVVVERAYGSRPAFNYYVGTSQGGREALTVAQRYPADYNGIVANVPIVNFSTLMLGPELIRIQEKPTIRWHRQVLSSTTTSQ
jgi:feruloyl esterase